MKKNPFADMKSMLKMFQKLQVMYIDKNICFEIRSNRYAGRDFYGVEWHLSVTVHKNITDYTECERIFSEMFYVCDFMTAENNEKNYYKLVEALEEL